MLIFIHCIEGHFTFSFLDCVPYNEDFIILNQGSLYQGSFYCNFGRPEKNRLLYGGLCYMDQGSSNWGSTVLWKWLLATFIKNRIKIEPKEIFNCLILDDECTCCIYLGTWNILVTCSPDCVSNEVQLLCCGISRYRLFPAPWDVESAYYSEPPAEQWCIQSYKSQIHGSSNSIALCECPWCLIVKLFWCNLCHLY